MSEPLPVNKQLPASSVSVLAWFEPVRLNQFCYRSGWVRAMYVAKHSYEEPNIDMCEIDCEYDETTDAYYIPEGWYELIEHWDDYAFVAIGDSYTVTHWLSLPDPPRKPPKLDWREAQGCVSLDLPADSSEAGYHK